MARTWIQKLAFSIKKIKEPLFSNLIQNGVISRREHRFAGLIKYSRYPVRQEKLKESIISEIRELVLEDKTTSNDVVLLACLAKACQFTRKIFINRDERKIARKKIKKLMNENEMSGIINDTLAQINAAIIASVSVATIASTSGSS
jgi:ethanolamine ammonia-lyase large subunit